MSSLVKVVGDFIALDQIMIDNDGILNDEEQELIINQWINELSTGLADKVDAYVFKIESIDRAIDALNDRESRIYKSKKTLKTLEEKLKERVKFAMTELNKEKLIGNENIITMSNSKKSVVIKNEELIPASFTREVLKIEIDKDLIKKAIDSGIEVPGAELKESKALRFTKNTGLIKG